MRGRCVDGPFYGREIAKVVGTELHFPYLPMEGADRTIVYRVGEVVDGVVELSYMGHKR